MNTYLHLETGERFEGVSIGSHISSEGEVVFSTGMTGYVESLTDPSFAGQILVFTYPLIGNYGVPKPQFFLPHCMVNFESERIWVKGVVVGEACESPSHHQSVQSFTTWLEEQQIPGIAGVDTRALTHLVREKGCMRGKISSKKSVHWDKPQHTHWVSEVSCKEPILYPSIHKKSKHIVLIDCGVKHGIVRKLIEEGYSITRIPWNEDPLSISHIDGVVVSNGPGDPKSCTVTVKHVQDILKKDIPYLGVCLGHQLLALAIGADTYKLPYGHRGINQPCLDVSSQKAYVTSQNHGYAVRRESIPQGFKEWFINLNDKTNEGIRHTKKSIQSVQFHPEGYPGPSDTSWIWKVL